MVFRADEGGLLEGSCWTFVTQGFLLWGVKWDKHQWP